MQLLLLRHFQIKQKVGDNGIFKQSVAGNYQDRKRLRGNRDGQPCRIMRAILCSFGAWFGHIVIGAERFAGETKSKKSSAEYATSKLGR